MVHHSEDCKTMHVYGSPVGKKGQGENVSLVGVLKEVLGYYYSKKYVHYKLALVENPDALTPTTTPFTLMP